MARFYEEYGYSILWALTSALGAGLIYWFLVALAMHGGMLPGEIEKFILQVHGMAAGLIADLFLYVEKRIQWFGALATLATFVFGLVTGIRQAKRHLPRRLMQFMTEQLAPVYDNSEALVAAVAYRSADVEHRAQLFRRDPLNRALNALGDPFRPRRRRSLDEAIREADKYIEITERRLEYLRDMRSHAQILRGAVRSLEAHKGKQDAASNDQAVEADFEAAIENETSRLAGLELRGLFRSRLGNLRGALQDFRDLETDAQEAFCPRARARALRHQAEVLRRQAAGTTNATLLRRARRQLNVAERMFDGRTLGADDWCELGHNRECYGEVQADLATIAGSKMDPALSAFNSAIGHFRLADPPCSAGSDRVRERIKRLEAPQVGS